MLRTHFFKAAIVFGLSALAGCSQSGPQRYRVQGKVTFAGKPVPAGTIVFEPDATQGNDGPQGIAPIEKGIFDTAFKGGRPTVGGLHHVTILGCDGTNISEVSPQGKNLFEPYFTTADLPRKAGNVDFDVPASATRH
jgi:hypothetical protein